MSLTSILSDKKYQILRDKLKIDFSRPDFELKTSIKAPPLTTNYAIVGTAFDYLFRFFLEKINKDKIEHREVWVADNAFSVLKGILSSSKAKTIYVGVKQDKNFKTKELLKLIIDQYKQSKENYHKYINGCVLSDELISNTIFLAKLDLFSRTGIIDGYFDFHNPEDIKDIRSMLSLVDEEKFQSKKECYLNPTFGLGSAIVGGADADLIIDDTLIEIKATKDFSLSRSNLNQIIGYYVLCLIGGVNQKPNERPIKKVGIYFARHGVLWTVPLSCFGNEQKFLDFKEWFIDYLKPISKTNKEWYQFIDGFNKVN